MQKINKILIVGLGNVGEAYVHTRHNIGFDIVDAWAKKHELVWKLSSLAFVAPLKYRGVDIHLIKPTTYMNLSGKAVKLWMQKLQLSASGILVVVDDLAFDRGEVKLRLQGNHGGHNGLKSVQEELGTPQYARLRCGIGKDFGVGQQSNYVLGKWREEEIPALTQMIEKGEHAIDEVLKSNLSLAMNKINA